MTSSSSSYEDEEGEMEQEEPPSVSGFVHMTHGNVEVDEQVNTENKFVGITFQDQEADELTTSVQPTVIVKSSRREN